MAPTFTPFQMKPPYPHIVAHAVEWLFFPLSANQHHSQRLLSSFQGDLGEGAQ